MPAVNATTGVCDEPRSIAGKASPISAPQSSEVPAWPGVPKHFTSQCTTLIFSFPCFFGKSKENHQEKQGFFLYAETPKILGKEGKNAQKSKEIPCNEKSKEIQKKQGKEDQGKQSQSLAILHSQGAIAENFSCASRREAGLGIASGTLAHRIARSKLPSRNVWSRDQLQLFKWNAASEGDRRARNMQSRSKEIKVPVGRKLLHLKFLKTNV